MKKKLLTFLAAAIACAALVFAFSGCSGNEEAPQDGNYAEIVLKTLSGEMDDWTSVGHFVTGSYGTGYGVEWLDDYEMSDLTGNGLPFNNYSDFCFWWKNNDYRITKIEFDVTAQTAFETVIYVGNPRTDLTNVYQEVNLSAGGTVHVSMPCSLERNTGFLSIENNQGYAYGDYCTAMWKLSNLKITAEKI